MAEASSGKECYTIGMRDKFACRGRIEASHLLNFFHLVHIISLPTSAQLFSAFLNSFHLPLPKRFSTLLNSSLLLSPLPTLFQLFSAILNSSLLVSPRLNSSQLFSALLKSSELLSPLLNSSQCFSTLLN